MENNLKAVAVIVICLASIFFCRNDIQIIKSFIFYKNTNPEYTKNNKRYLGLDLRSTFGFVHISKCAGSSYIQELKKLWGPPQQTQEDLEYHLYPVAEAGKEHSIKYQQENYPSQYTLTAIKSPRHHVWSLFTECRYDENWSGKFIHKTGFPFQHQDGAPEGDLMDFELWLDHFLVTKKKKETMTNATENQQVPTNITQPQQDIVETKDIHKTGNSTQNEDGDDEYYYEPKLTIDNFKCYHPSNYQSRAFSVVDAEPHNIVDDLEPDFDIVKKTYWELDWVGIADLFHESKCLLYYRMTQQATTTPTKINTTMLLRNKNNDKNTYKNTNSHQTWSLIQDFLDSNCHCDRPQQKEQINSSTTEDENNVHVVHHSQGHRSSMRDGISNDILNKIAALIRIDSELFRLGFIQTLREIAWLESHSHLNRRILCDDRLKSLDYELEYLWPEYNNNDNDSKTSINKTKIDDDSPGGVITQMYHDIKNDFHF